MFRYSPVFRFAAILLQEDYQNRKELLNCFFEKSAEISAFAQGPWEEVHVAAGIAAYDPQTDRMVEDVIRRADRVMYQNKRDRKNQT